MVELGIDVKHSAYKLSNQEAEKRKKVTRVCVYTFVVAMLPFGAMIITLANTEDRQDVPPWYLVVYKAHVPTIFSLLSVGLASASYYTIRNLRFYFDKRLQFEVLRIKTTFIVFTVAYMTRVLTFVLL